MEVRMASLSGTADEAADAAERALADDGAIFAEEPDPMGAMGAVSALMSAERFDQARYAVERAIAIAHERASTPDLSLACGIRGVVALGSGDLLAAEVDVRQALDIARLAGIAALVMLGVPHEATERSGARTPATSPLESAGSWGAGWAAHLSHIGNTGDCKGPSVARDSTAIPSYARRESDRLCGRKVTKTAPWQSWKRSTTRFGSRSSQTSR